MDIEFLLLLQQFRETTGGILDPIFLAITELGDSTAMILIAVLLYFCVDKKVGSFVIMNGLFGTVINGFLKITFCVYRPWVKDARILPLQGALKGATGYSFPSGHATIATAVYGGMGVRCYQGAKKMMGILCFILMGLIAFSRTYVGVHTPQDVLVAMGLGFLLLWGTTKLEQLLLEKPRLDLLVTLGILIAGVLLMLYAATKAYPLDMVDGQYLADPAMMQKDSFAAAGGAIGFALGWFLERRAVHFTIEGSVVVKALRYIFAVTSVLAVKSVSKAVAFSLFQDNVAEAVEMMFVVFWIMGILPLLFKLVEGRFVAKRA